MGKRRTMKVDSRTLSAEESVRDVGHHVRVGVTDSIHAGNVGNEALGRIRRKTAIDQLHAQIRSNPAGLFVIVRCEEGVALDKGGATVGLLELDAEEVVLRVGGQAGVAESSILEPVDAGDGAVVNRHIVKLQVRLPPGEGLLRSGTLLLRIGPIDKGHDITVERGHLPNKARDARQRREETQTLVRVLVPVTPRAPVDALAPILPQAGGLREEVVQAGGENDLAGGDGLCGDVAARDLDGEEGVVLVRVDLGHGAVCPGDGLVVGELLPGGPAVVCGCDACLTPTLVTDETVVQLPLRVFVWKVVPSEPMRSCR